MTTTHMGAVLDESDKMMIDKMMPLLNEYQRRAFLGLYCEKLGYGSVTQASDFIGMSSTTLTAAKREVAELENDPRARPYAGELGRIRTEDGERKNISEKQPGIRNELLRLLDSNVPEDPGSLLTWTRAHTLWPRTSGILATSLKYYRRYDVEADRF